MPIVDLDLSVRCRLALVRAGLETVGDLLELAKADLADQLAHVQLSIQEIDDILAGKRLKQREGWSQQTAAERTLALFGMLEGGFGKRSWGTMLVKTLQQLTESGAPAIALIRNWTEAAENHCEILPPSTERAAVLLEVQVTTHSTMGAIAFETGGVLIDHGWLRFLGSGHPRLTRTLPGWNRERSNGFYLVADDAVGGFFAMNGGAFGDDTGKIYYWAPDRLDWEGLEVGFTDFFHWSLTVSERLKETSARRFKGDQLD